MTRAGGPVSSVHWYERLVQRLRSPDGRSNSAFRRGGDQLVGSLVRCSGMAPVRAVVGPDQPVLKESGAGRGCWTSQAVDASEGPDQVDVSVKPGVRCPSRALESRCCRSADDLLERGPVTGVRIVSRPHNAATGAATRRRERVDVMAPTVVRSGHEEALDPGAGPSPARLSPLTTLRGGNTCRQS